MSNDKMRAEFERTNGRDHRRFPPKGNNYIDPHAQLDWEAFQKGWNQARATSSLCPGHGRAECVSCCWPVAERPAGYTAVDMSTAAADGYRDGKANFKLPAPKRVPGNYQIAMLASENAMGWNECLEAIRELNK